MVAPNIWSFFRQHPSSRRRTAPLSFERSVCNWRAVGLYLFFQGTLRMNAYVSVNISRSININANLNINRNVSTNIDTNIITVNERFVLLIHVKYYFLSHKICRCQPWLKLPKTLTRRNSGRTWRPRNSSPTFDWIFIICLYTMCIYIVDTPCCCAILVPQQCNYTPKLLTTPQSLKFVCSKGAKVALKKLPSSTSKEITL